MRDKMINILLLIFLFFCILFTLYSFNSSFFKATGTSDKLEDLEKRIDKIEQTLNISK